MKLVLQELLACFVLGLLFRLLDLCLLFFLHSLRQSRLLFGLLLALLVEIVTDSATARDLLLPCLGCFASLGSKVVSSDNLVAPTDVDSEARGENLHTVWPDTQPVTF